MSDIKTYKLNLEGANIYKEGVHNINSNTEPKISNFKKKIKNTNKEKLRFYICLQKQRRLCIFLKIFKILLFLETNWFCYIWKPPNLYINLACLFVCLFVCLFESNKRQNGWTDRAQIFCGTSRDNREGLWIIKISNICLHQNSIVIKFFKILKIREIFVKIRELFLFCFTMYTKRTCSQLI